MSVRDRLRTTIPHRRRHVAAVLAALALTAVVVGSDSTPSRSALAPAELISVTDTIPDANNPSISDDGAFVAYDADTSTITASRVRDRAAATTQDVPDPGTPFNGDLSRVVISGDGCQVVRVSEAISITDICTDNVAKLLDNPGCDCSPNLIAPRVSTHGRYITVVAAYQHEILWFDRDADANGVLDDTDIVSRAITAVDNNTGAALGDETLTNRVAVVLPDQNIDAPEGSFQVYLWDPSIDIGDPTGLTLVSAQNGSSTAPIPGASATFPSMTPDGRYVAFVSSTGSSDGGVFSTGQIMVRDTVTDETALVSRSEANATANSASSMPSISADGTQVAFGTTATNLLAPNPGGRGFGCTGGEFSVCSGPTFDLLVATSTAGFFASIELDRVSLDRNGNALAANNIYRVMILPDISASGRWVAFQSSFRQEIQSGAVTPVDQVSAVYVIERPASATIDQIDFASVTVGTTSATLTATVTNTSNSSILPATITASNGFAIVPGGTCAAQVWLSPRRSCTVNITFAPATEGAITGQLTIAESGYAAYTATGVLTGTGFVEPPPTTATTVPEATTTMPETTTSVENLPAIPVSIPTTTTTTTTTTMPRPVVTVTVTVVTTPPTTTIPLVPGLIITTNPGSFGTAMVSTSAPPITFAVTSTGSGPATVNNLTVSGVDAASFVITDNTCAGVSLRPGSSCAVTIVFTPATVGVHNATLTVGSAAVTATAALDGTGTLTPTIRLSPNVVGPGEVAVAFGAGFVPNSTVQLHWVDDATSGETSGAIADAAGNFTVQIPIGSDEEIGPRTFGAVDQPGLFTNVTTPALIVDPSARPPTGRNPAIPGLGTLVSRG
ncbi:MAG: choice-of-anchor D domain-containing protein [Ilumatobacteraceae bacterium]